MKNKKRNFVILDIEDVNSIISLGKMFYETGKRIALQYVRQKKAGKHFESDLLAVAATNIILSFELYLKALILGTTGEYGTGHELKVLYSRLPGEVQLTLKKYFADGLSKTRGDMPIIRRLSPLPGEPEYDPWSQEISLLEFLEVHNEGFMEWRYHFQPELQKTIYADFALMTVLNNVLKKSVKEYIL